MTEFTRVRTVPVRRGAVSRFNDNTMEYVIAVARVVAVLATLGTLGAGFASVWTLDIHWISTCLLGALVTVGLIWFGFIRNGNEEWFSGPTNT